MLWSFKAASFVLRIVWSLWNLAGTLAAVLSRCLSNFKVMQLFKLSILWLRDYMKSYDKVYHWILKQGPCLCITGLQHILCKWHTVVKVPLHRGPGWHFRNAYEFVNLRSLKFSLYENCIFQCMGKIFCVEFQRYPLKFHTKFLTHTLKDV